MKSQDISSGDQQNISNLAIGLCSK